MFNNKKTERLKFLYTQVQKFGEELDKVYSISVSSAQFSGQNVHEDSANMVVKNFIKKWTIFFDKNKKYSGSNTGNRLKDALFSLCSRFISYSSGNSDFTMGLRDEICKEKDELKERFNKIYEHNFSKVVEKRISLPYLIVGSIIKIDGVADIDGDTLFNVLEINLNRGVIIVSDINISHITIAVIINDKVALKRVDFINLLYKKTTRKRISSFCDFLSRFLPVIQPKKKYNL